MLNRCSPASAPVAKRYSWLSNPLLGAASNSQATAPRNGGVTNEAVTSARMNCRPGISVRDTSHPIGAATTQQIAADVVAMMAVVSSGSRKSGSVDRVTKFCGGRCRALSVTLKTASHDSGSTISTTRHAANSHSTGLVQSIFVRVASMLLVMVMLFSILMLSLPAGGERRKNEAGAGEGHLPANPKSVRHSGPAPGGASRNDNCGFGAQGRSNPKQPRVAGLDLFRHFLDAGGVFLHQLDVGNLAAARFRLHLRMNRILRGEVDEELLGFPGVQPGLKQPRGIGMRRGQKYPGRPRDRRRALGRIHRLDRLAGFLQQHDIVFVAIRHHAALAERQLLRRVGR